MTKKENFRETALTLIHEKGFKAMTMRDLANRLSCDIKNLYNYTPSKQALLEDILSEIAEDFHNGLSNIVKAELSAVRQVEELIRLHIELSFQKPKEVGLLVNDWRNLSVEKLTDFKVRRNEYEQKVKNIVVKGMQQGEFKKTDPDVAQQYLLGSLRWLYDLHFEDGENSNPLSVFELLKALILPGLCNSTKT